MGASAISEGMLLGRTVHALIALLLVAAAADASQGPPEDQPQPTPLALSRAFDTPANLPLTLRANARCDSIRLDADEGQCWNLARFDTLEITASREKAGSSVLRLRWIIHSRVGGMY